MSNTMWAGKRVWMAGGVVLALLLVELAANAGRLLIVDSPQPSDVILVLAGETDRRPARALELLDRGYGRRVVIDVPAAASIYGFSQVTLAEEYIQRLPQAASLAICPSPVFLPAMKPTTPKSAWLASRPIAFLSSHRISTLAAPSAYFVTSFGRTPSP